jgi:hypothetical protein
MNFNCLTKKHEGIFFWMIINYTRLAVLYCPVFMEKEIFDASAKLFHNIDDDIITKGPYSKHDKTQLYALKHKLTDMYFSSLKNYNILKSFPFLKIVTLRNEKVVYLFKCVPFLRFNYGTNTVKIRLFNYIPLSFLAPFLIKVHYKYLRAIHKTG